MSYDWRIGATTIGVIVDETADAVIEALEEFIKVLLLEVNLL